MAKITQEELEKFKSLQQQINQNLFELGQTEVTIHNLKEQQKIVDKNKEDIMSILLTLSQNELEYMKSLENTYGKGTVNIDTGEITV